MNTPLRILIVEDSENDALLLLRELRRGGYDPTFARVDTAAAMKAALDAQAWDVVLCDYHIPRFSAPAALALLKDHGLDLPFIIVSGMIGEDVAVAMMKAGAHDYVMKDRLTRLVLAIERELREAEGQRERRRMEAALRESEAQFRTSIENLLDGFAILSAVRDDAGGIVDFRYEYINETGCQLNQRTCEEHVGHTLLELLPAHKDTGLLDEYARVVETGQPLVRESLLYEDVYGGGQRMKRAFDVRAVKLGDGFVVSWRDVTARKQAEAARHESEAKFRALTENAAAAIFINQGTRLRYANPAFTAVTGYTPEDLLTMNFWDVVHPNHRELVKQRGLARQRGEEVPSRYEFKVATKSGEERWVDFTADVIEFEGQSAIIGTAYDITERKRAELRSAAFAALGQRLNAARSVEEAARVIVKTADELCEWDACFVDLYSPERDAVYPVFRMDTMDGRRVEVAPGVAGTPPSAMPRRAIAEGGQLVLRGTASFTPQMTPFGDTSRPSASLLFVPIRHDERVTGVLSVQSYTPHAYNAEDLRTLQALADYGGGAMERLQAEESLRQQLTRISLLNQITRAIAERHDLRSIFQVVLRQLEDYLPIDFGGISLYDDATRTFTIAALGPRSQTLAAEMNLGESRSLPFEKVPSIFHACLEGQSVYVPDLARLAEPLAQQIAQRGIGSLIVNPLMVEGKVFGTLSVVRRDANGFSSAECEFLRTLSEHVALAAHHARLLADLQEAYDDLRQTQEAVMQQERLRALGQMASGIAHDINNALAPIVGFSELLLMSEPNLSARIQEYLETMLTAGNDIAHIVARMRDFYRQRETIDILQPIDLNRVVQQAVNLTRPRWKDMPQERGILITMQTDLPDDLPDDLPAVMGIEPELREALTNLIFNAVDAMPDGGVITIRTIAEGMRDEGLGMRDDAETKFRTSSLISHLSSLILEVSDTGVGMDEETRQRCLEPFFSTKGERGTGLGLAMVYGVMQRHDGQVEIESAIGEGTTVRLIFPLPESVGAGVPASLEADEPLPPLRILCVDDEPLLRGLMKDMLEADGHSVELADSGQAGLEAFLTAQEQGKPVDVVLTDLGMPHVDGRRVAREIKRASPRTPVILLTGWGARLRADGDVPHDVDVLLSKPPRVNELRRTLARVTAKRVSGS